MKIDFSKITLSIEEEKQLNFEFEKLFMKPKEENKICLKRALEGYKDFDFSQLDFLNANTLLYKTREAFFNIDELASRPFLFPLFIFYRNGYLDRDVGKIDNFKFEYDLTNFDKATMSKNKVPQGLITEDGVLHTCGVDGHLWLYYFLNFTGVNTKNIVRYGVWIHPDTKEIQQNFTRLEKYQDDRSNIFLSEKQAIAIENLRSILDP